MKQRPVLALFNRGRVSRLALARTDVSRVAMSAETQTNWMPRKLGSMMLRPGLEFLGETDGDGVYIPFIFSATDFNILEMTDGKMRIWDSGTTLLNRPTVTADITNPDFDSDLSGWADNDEAGATSDWNSGQMRLVGTGYAAAIRRQEVTVNEAGIRHALRVVIERGPVTFRVGTAEGSDNLVDEAKLGTGAHSLAFTPSGASFWIEFSTRTKYPVQVDSCNVEDPGVVEFATPWTSLTLNRSLRWAQSADVVYIASTGLQQRKVERRANNSWSLVRYEPEDGPFLVENLSGVRLTPSAISGAVTITASQRVFRDSMLGALLRIASVGQRVQSDLSADSTFTDPIRVVGVGSANRTFSIDIAGTWSGTISLQRSIGEPGNWVTDETYTGNTTTDYDDDLDNVIVYYRLGFEGTGHTSGTAECMLTYSGGSITGVARITGFNSTVSVDAVVLKDFGSTEASEIWAEGAWSDRRGWPSAVALSEGRLWWAGKGRAWGSVSDAYESFDPDFEGDAGPINRFVGDGPVDTINWLVSAQRLIAGGDGAEYSIRSTSFDEPITPSNYNVKDASTYGSAAMPAVKYDKRVVFVDRSRSGLYELGFAIDQNDYAPTDLTALIPEIAGDDGFVRIAVQRKPDTRIHCVRGDGTVGVLVRDMVENVTAWVDVETEGEVIDVCVLPGTIEDRVFYMVERDIDGSPVFYHERWALESEARGGQLNKQADSFVAYSGAPATVISGGDHLENETVVAWGDGEYLGEFEVNSGHITLDDPVSVCCYGLGYTALYKSAKLAIDMQGGSGLTQRGRIDHLGLILADTHVTGLEFGPNFTTMDRMPLLEHGGSAVSGVWDEYDEEMIEFPGEWDSDNRLCLRASAPRPVTVLAAVISIDKQDRG